MDTPAVCNPAPSVGTPGIPSKVQAAQQFLYYADQVRSPRSLFEGAARDEKELSREEQSVYVAALNVMRLYFNGEMDFTDPMPTRPPSENDQNPRVSVNR